MQWSQFVWPTGRINRAPYWITAILGNVAFTALDRLTPGPTGAAAVLLGGVGVIVVYVNACLFIARLHDIGHSGWWVLVMVAGVAAMLASAFAAAQSTQASGVAVVTVCLSAIVLIGGTLYAGIRRGTQGPNRFGPDPLSQ